MNEQEYREAFSEVIRNTEETKEVDTRAGRALAAALDIRKFEIDLYWKRATYFWAFIAAAFAGYALTYKTATEHEPWLLITFSSLGLVFASAWYLANRGSKFWQNNWERHVDLLEDMTLGPLHKIIAINREPNLLTAAGPFSVTKINQILSFFVALVWLLLFVKSINPVFIHGERFFEVVIIILTAGAILTFLVCGKSRVQSSIQSELIRRTFQIIQPKNLSRNSKTKIRILTAIFSLGIVVSVLAWCIDKAPILPKLVKIVAPDCAVVQAAIQILDKDENAILSPDHPGSIILMQWWEPPPPGNIRSSVSGIGRSTGVFNVITGLHHYELRLLTQNNSGFLKDYIWTDTRAKDLMKEAIDNILYWWSFGLFVLGQLLTISTFTWGVFMDKNRPSTQSHHPINGGVASNDSAVKSDSKVAEWPG